MAGLMCQINSILCQPANSWFWVSGTGCSGCWIHQCRRQSKSPQWSCMHTYTRIQDCSVVILGKSVHPGCHSRNIHFGCSLHQSWKRSRVGVPKSRWRWLRASFSSCLGCWKSLAVRSWDFGATDFTVDSFFGLDFYPWPIGIQSMAAQEGQPHQREFSSARFRFWPPSPCLFNKTSLYICARKHDQNKTSN